MDKRSLHRYPGVQPFKPEDGDIFFGRESDTAKLHRLIMLEKLVIVFGKSGHGKSSIINAGIIPLLRDPKVLERFQYMPIEVRIGRVTGLDESPVKKLLLKINEQFTNLSEWSFLNEYTELPKAWLAMKSKQSSGNRRFLLIFDQFEEFFNYSIEEQEAFRWELADLLYTDVPQCIRDNPEKISDEQYNLLSERFDLKVLISIRSDRLSNMHSLKDALPRILDNRFEIKGLSIEQASQAITKPASLNSEKFITHSFTYDRISLDIILKELLSIHDDGMQSIEAFHLQIICQGCETRIEEKLRNNEIDIEINEEDLPNFKNLYEEYYKRQIEKLPTHLQNKARLFLEEGFIFEDEQTGDHRRLSVDGNILRKLIANMKLDDDILTLLENAFLIRRETNNVGGFSYEISHDTIVNPILKYRNDRRLAALQNSAVRNAAGKIKRRIFAACLFGMLILAGIKWKTLYFGYRGFTEKAAYPVVRLNDKLDSIVSHVSGYLMSEVGKMDSNYLWGPWTASQLVTGLGNKVNDDIKSNYYKLTNKLLVDTCCCWREIVNQNDFRASGWIGSAIGYLKLVPQYRCNIFDFFLNNQLEDGSWSMLLVDRGWTQYSSTYATCHVIRALKSMLSRITDLHMQRKIEASIKKGGEWLVANRFDTATSKWKDYPKDSAYQAISSMSLSGLAIHTLNLIGMSTPEINRKWLYNWRLPQTMISISAKEQSDVFYRLNEDVKGVATDRDLTRHLILPWEIIATIDAYKDGGFYEKIEANIWLDEVVQNLNENEILQNQLFVIAEIFIALRYLDDRNYKFR